MNFVIQTDKIIKTIKVERYVMRVGLSIVFSLLIVALLVCKVLTKLAKKAISPHVSFLLSGFR